MRALSRRYRDPLSRLNFVVAVMGGVAVGLVVESVSRLGPAKLMQALAVTAMVAPIMFLACAFVWITSGEWEGK